MDIPEYTTIFSKRKSISIVINRNGEIIVKAPVKTNKLYINEIIKSRINFINKHRDIILKKRAIHPKKECKEGETFYYLGDEYKLHFDINETKIKIQNNNILVPIKETEILKIMIIKWYKREAKTILANRLNYFSSKTSINYNSLKITSAKNRWGSCGRQGNINLNWKLVMLPIELIDAVVVHELVHIKIDNHSKKYYEKVREIISNYNELNKELKKHSAILDELF